jgi:3',5'-cyclic AMP phosphodiesterase CpdA
MRSPLHFAIISDLHIALPHTIWQHPSRVHRVELAIPALETVLDQLSHQSLDFLLIPGDLTQHGEPENHRWLANRLAQLPYPVYVIPGNHDIPVAQADGTSIAPADFPAYYQGLGYRDSTQLYYTCELAPGVQLIALNSNMFNAAGQQIGRLDATQLTWLEEVLANAQGQFIIVMVHHNLLDHIPEQSQHPIGRRYILENAVDVRSLLTQAKVQLVFTGHLHIQDIAQVDCLVDITTGSLISYPHPYRIARLSKDDHGAHWLDIQSHHIQALPNHANLQRTSRQWLAARSSPYMRQLLTQPPLNLDPQEAELLVPSLRYFWADLSHGDAQFDFAHFPPSVQRYFARFSAAQPIDNNTKLRLRL